MEYRRLGTAGLKVSVLSFGSWVSFNDQMGVAEARACMEAAYDAGVNFFDNAESYAGGESERIMGAAIAELGWPRYSYVVSTKVFWGLHDGPNMQNTLNRKYLMQAIDGSLERLGLDFVDLLFCHRADPNTPIEETVWAMSDIVASGQAHYWGTSEWAADEFRAAWDIADRHHLHKPVMEQPQYNLTAPPAGRAGVRAALRGLRSRAHDVEPARVGSARPASTSTASPKAAAARCRATSGCSDSLTDERTNEQGARGQGRSPTSSAARSRSWRSRGARTTRTCRP